jgi:hypothetical protein
VGVFMAGIILITFAIPDAVARVIMGMIIGTVLLYDPILVSMRGGTVGHYRLNLRVVRTEGGTRVGFLRALIRAWLKAFTGLFSFFFMALTRRHQALHDLATGCAVVIHDLSTAEPYHYNVARRESGEPTQVSRGRRIVFIALYWLAVFVVLSVLPIPFVSANCLDFAQCTDGENLVFSLVGIAMVIGFGSTMVLGWLGKLPGVRSRDRTNDG